MEGERAKYIANRFACELRKAGGPYAVAAHMAILSDLKRQVDGSYVCWISARELASRLGYDLTDEKQAHAGSAMVTRARKAMVKIGALEPLEDGTTKNGLAKASWGRTAKYKAHYVPRAGPDSPFGVDITGLTDKIAEAIYENEQSNRRPT